MQWSVLLIFTVSLVVGFDLHSSKDDYLSGVESDKCTTIVVGASAGVTGPMNTHTADCSDCDFRINKVPAKDWPQGSMR